MEKVALEFIGSEMAAGLIGKLPSVMGKLKDLRTDSLIEYTKSTRVEPIVLFDETLRLQPYIGDVFQTLVNIFAGYYLQAVAVSCNVGTIEVKKLLGKLSPDRYRDPTDVVNLLSRRYIEGIEYSLEKDPYPKSDIPVKERDWETRAEWDRKVRKEEREIKKDKYGRRRDTREDVRRRDETRYKRKRDVEEDWRRKDETRYKRGRDVKEDVRREDETGYKRGRDVTEDVRREEEAEYKRGRDIKEDERREEETEYKRQRDKEEDERRDKVRLGVSQKSIDDLNTNVNLSAGKTISVEIESEGSRAVIPVNIRLIVKNCHPSALASFLTVIKSDRRVSTRWKKWRSGEISFFKDLVMCQDILDEEKKAHMTDKEGMFRNLRERNKKQENTLYDIAINDINVATASSIIVMSKEAAKDVESTLYGKLDNYRVREQLFSVTFTMMLLVVDTQWEKITMYHRSIDEPSVLSVKDFRIGGRDSGPDINEVLMAYRAGTAPTF